MSTAIIVVCNHRTGSGLVASMLHTLGVPMLPTVEPTRTDDTRWEDEDFLALHRRIFREIVNGRYNPTAWRYPMPKFTPEIVREYCELILARDADRPVWGFKDPRTVFVLDFALGLMHGLGIDIRLVWLTRWPEQVAASLEKRDGKNWPTDHLAVAHHQLQQWETMLGRYFTSVPGVEIRYDHLTANPEAAVTKLQSLLAPLQPTAAQAKAAADLVWKGHH